MKQHLKHKTWRVGISVTIFLISLNSFGTQAIAEFRQDSAVLLSQETNSSSNPKISAQELFRKVYENSYTWSPQFPGYTAVVEVKYNNKSYKGRVRVNSDLNVEVTGISNEEIRQGVETSLRIIATHRQQKPFEQVHKNSTFKFGATDQNGSVEIIEQGETEASYKISKGRLIQINRVLGNRAVTTNVLNSKKTSEGYLPTRYQSVFSQPQTKQVQKEEQVEDTYKKIGGYYLPTRQVFRKLIKGQITETAELNYSDIQLLSSNR